MSSNPIATNTYSETINAKSVTDIIHSYNQIKATVADATTSLNGSATFSGMDDVSEIVSTGIAKIDEFIESTKKPSVASKALSIIDPKNKWAGKWASNASESLKKEEFKERTIDDIANQIIKGINKQREDVISYMESLVDIRTTLTNSRESYENLAPSVNEALAQATPNTREELDLKSIVTRITKSIMQLDATVRTEINPLIASANIAIQEIDNQLPDIEYDLKYKGSLKIAQQSLSNLIGMAKTVKSMTENAGDVIRKDIHDTTIESIEMVGDVIMDTKRLSQIQEQEQQHMQKVKTAMENTVNKINSNFTDVQQLHATYVEHKEATSALLLDTPTVKSSNDSNKS
jgi:hypothetical protein